MVKLVKIGKTSLFKDTCRFLLYVSSIKFPVCFETQYFLPKILNFKVTCWQRACVFHKILYISYSKFILVILHLNLDTHNSVSVFPGHMSVLRSKYQEWLIVFFMSFFMKFDCHKIRKVMESSFLNKVLTRKKSQKKSQNCAQNYDFRV